ncbi:UDP-N-acetylmuramoyl-L-alanyl-D-glutamate--2,6-diaminopimelate ligase [Fodinicola feengrottensis]|uniref:UDP-N-acetylmuramoyl-L-alanyl-D-glutamate--2,6-diaminopimelate ligase n=1 Tax=Fodinicola feengrottensis TaxID=435914 RepID=A0ABP4TQU5_9ACTN
MGMLASLGGADLRGAAEVAVTGVTHDSRAVRPGDLYAALSGSVRHGAEFAADAISSGAAAILTDPAGAAMIEDARLPIVVVDRPRNVLGKVAAQVYGDPTSQLTVLGVTGTSGKTTTAYLLEAGLLAAGHVTGVIGTVETRYAGVRLPSARTTPEAPDLQALFAVMVEQGVTAVAIEVSSHALAQGRADGIRFAVGAFANLGADHLDFHADMEDYFAAKAMLFDGRCRREVVNVDDAYGRRLVTDETVTVSTGGLEADWRAVDIDTSAVPQTFMVMGPHDVRLQGSVQLPGPFNVDNALLAIAVLTAAGIDARTAVDGVASCAGVPGRLQRVGADTRPDLLSVVDYAHKPGAVAAVLDALRPVTRGRLIAVLGCGGDRDTGKRPLMGEAGARGADVLIITDDNPRSEDPAAIRAAALAGAAAVPARQRAEVLEIGDRAEAIERAVRLAGPGDTVAILGKGHEPYQEIGGQVFAFDDREELDRALRATNGQVHA